MDGSLFLVGVVCGVPLAVVGAMLGHLAGD